MKVFRLAHVYLDVRFRRGLKRIKIGFLFLIRVNNFRRCTYIILISEDSKPLKSLQTNGIGGNVLVMQNSAHETHALSVIVMKFDATGFAWNQLAFRKPWTKESAEDPRSQTKDLG